MRLVAAIVLVFVIGTTTAVRSSPRVDFGWLQGRWSCDDGGYDSMNIVPVVGRAAGRSSMTMSWHTAVDDVSYELRRQPSGLWKLEGRAREKTTHDYVAWDLLQRSGRTGDVTFEGTARFVKARDPFQIPIRWELIETDHGQMAQWRWYYRDGRWTNAQSRHCRLDSATP